MQSVLAKVGRWCGERGLTPNAISCTGFLFALAAGVCFAVGAGHAAPWSAERPSSAWPLAGGLLLLLAGILDLLDGAVARGGNLQTRFGGVLDSTLDRFGDMAIFVGCSIYFARQANLTYVLLGGLAMVATVQISYVKARAESFTDGMGVGFWQRGERTVALILGGLFGHVATVLWILATLPMFTVLRRLRQAWVLLHPDAAMPPADRFVPPWQRPRSSAAYLLVCAAIATFILVAPWLASTMRANADPLRLLLVQL